MRPKLIPLSMTVFCLPLIGFSKLLYEIKLLNFASASQLFALFPDMFGGVYIRRIWYKWTLKKCGTRLVTGWLTVVHDARATFGDECYIGQNVQIGWADIGDQCLIGSHAIIASGLRQHGIIEGTPIRKQPGYTSRTIIGSDVWIGAGCLIAANIANSCIVGLGSVVLDNLDTCNAIYGGYPAKLIKYRPKS